MPIATSTSPLLNLAIIGQLDLLPAEFGTIHVPEMVISELRLDSDRLGAAALRGVVGADWIQVHAAGASPLLHVLEQQLDAGEAEALALARQLGLSAVLIDEADGREAAKAMGLDVVGVLGVLLRAKSAGRLASPRPSLVALRADAGFFVADALYSEVLARAGER